VSGSLRATPAAPGVFVSAPSFGRRACFLRRALSSVRLGYMGFRVWLIDGPNPNEDRFYCGWLDGREHCVTVRWVEGDAEIP
jgi:hypothetical protein